MRYDGRINEAAFREETTEEKLRAMVLKLRFHMPGCMNYGMGNSLNCVQWKISNESFQLCTGCKLRQEVDDLLERTAK